MKSSRLVLAAALAAATAACVPRSEPAPPMPAPRPVAPPPAPALPPPPPPAADWRDHPLTPGNWYYQAEGAGSQASFGAGDGAASFVIRCDRTTRRVLLSRPGAPAGSAITVRTSSSARSLPLAGGAPSAAILAAGDPLLDAIAFSRGRFTVEAAGAPMLIIPAWPEAARVVEDCRP